MILCYVFENRIIKISAILYSAKLCQIYFHNNFGGLSLRCQYHHHGFFSYLKMYALPLQGVVALPNFDEFGELPFHHQI